MFLFRRCGNARAKKNTICICMVAHLPRGVLLGGLGAAKRPLEATILAPWDNFGGFGGAFAASFGCFWGDWGLEW